MTKIKIDENNKINIINADNDLGANKITFKQNSSGFWYCDLTLNCISLMDGLELIINCISLMDGLELKNKAIDRSIEILIDKNAKK